MYENIASDVSKSDKGPVTEKLTAPLKNDKTFTVKITCYEGLSSFNLNFVICLHTLCSKCVD